MLHGNRNKLLGLLGVAVLLSGCASTGSSGDTRAGQVKITSEPAGAIAYADGVELGATPLVIMPGDHFRSGFAGFSYRYIGQLSIKKAGCETWATEVNDAILSKNIHAKLSCDPDFKPASAAGNISDAMPKSSASEQYVERLERLESLHNKKLISDEEYKQLRARILEKL